MLFKNFRLVGKYTEVAKASSSSNGTKVSNGESSNSSCDGGPDEPKADASSSDTAKENGKEEAAKAIVDPKEEPLEVNGSQGEEEVVQDDDKKTNSSSKCEIRLVEMTTAETLKCDEEVELADENKDEMEAAAALTAGEVAAAASAVKTVLSSGSGS